MKKFLCVILSALLCFGALFVSGCGLIEREQPDDEVRQDIEALI